MHTTRLVVQLLPVPFNKKQTIWWMCLKKKSCPQAKKERNFTWKSCLDFFFNLEESRDSTYRTVTLKPATVQLKRQTFLNQPCCWSQCSIYSFPKLLLTGSLSITATPIYDILHTLLSSKHSRSPTNKQGSSTASHQHTHRPYTKHSLNCR